MKFLFSLLAVSLFLSLPLRAHDPGFSTAKIEVQPSELAAEITFHLQDAETLGLLHANPGRVAGSLAPEVLQVRLNDELLAPVRFEVKTDDEEATFFLTYATPAEGGDLEFSAPILCDLSFGHRLHFILTSADDERIAESLWSNSSHTFSLELEAPGSTIAEDGRMSLLAFLYTGMEHIFIGFDHVLFLFGLLLVCKTFRTAAIVITAFTIAHSITLALATVDLIRLPDNFVEPVIALSIVYVGMENLLRKGEPSKRWPLVFAFGLVHGVGFAGELRETNIGESSLASLIGPLLSFNIGVEIGQIMIATILLPAIWCLRRKPVFVRSGVAYCSVAIVFLGMYWLIERTVFT